MLGLLALSLAVRQDSPEALLHRVQDAIKSGGHDEVTALFADKADSGYLFRMSTRVGGLKNLRVAVFAAPQGWESTGKYWAMFHAWQELEQDHDPVFRVVETPQGLELGGEIPEWDCGGKVSKASAVALLNPSNGSAMLTSAIWFEQAKPGTALLFRLNDLYKVLDIDTADDSDQAPTTLDESRVDSPHKNFRVGSLLVYTPTAASGRLVYQYSAHIGNGASYSDDRDQITPTHAYITSFWIPSLGRLPFPTVIKVEAPKDWLVRSEGVQTATDPGVVSNINKLSTFRCDVPISYPKVCAGKYVLALEGNQNGHVLRSYQFAPVDLKRATDDVGWMKKAIAFYEANLGPFPFKEYDCLDGKDYYGIESYSYTILAPSITTWAVSHEMGHTYFGGVVPCAYVKDSWNEGMTQYVDDVLLHHNPEVEQNALGTLNISVPLTEMPVAWEYGGTTYYRGAYAMEMLDAEIGHDKVLAGLRAIIRDRVGKETNWPDLRQYFEKASGQDLQWFWDQWISAKAFPHVSIVSGKFRREGKGFMTRVTVKQSGTDKPYKLRFAVRIGGASVSEIREVMVDGEQSFEVGSDFEPQKASINPSPTALISVDAPVSVSAE